MTGRVATLVPVGPRAFDALAVLGVALAAAAAGVALTIEPVLAAVPVGGLLAALLLVDGRARILFVVFGGLLVFQQGEGGLDAPKMAFLLLFGVAFAGAFLRVRLLRATPAYRLAQPLLLGSIAIAVLALLSFAVAANNIIPQKDWLRDIAPYLLVASAPVFALDAQASLSRRRLVQLLIAAGTFGAIAFAVHWLERRGIAHLFASRLGLASHFPAAALFAFAMSFVLQAGRTRWLAVAAAVFAAVIVTGNRATLVLLLAPIAIAFGASRHRTARSVRLVVVGPLAIVTTLLVALVVVRATGADAASISERVDVLRSTASGSDASYSERLVQARVAWSVFTENPVLGHGPGTTFEWQTLSGRGVSSFVLDTPLTFPAKFGLVGLAVLAFLLTRYWTFVRGLIRATGPTVAHLALLGYLVTALGTAFGVSPLEDKGLSFGLMLMLALALADITVRHSQAAAPPGEEHQQPRSAGALHTRSRSPRRSLSPP